jgi:hypothetical protein
MFSLFRRSRQRMGTDTFAILFHLSIRAVFVISPVLALPFGVVAAEILTNDTSLVVFDAHGVRVGQLSNLSPTNCENCFQLGAGGVGRIDFRFGQFFFYIGVIPLGFVQTGNMYYESTDCTGQAWMRPSPPGTFIEAAGLGLPGHTVFVPDPSATPLSIPVRSFSYALGFCLTEPATSLDVVSPRALLNLDDRFTPPFTIPPFRITPRAPASIPRP